MHALFQKLVSGSVVVFGMLLGAAVAQADLVKLINTGFDNNTDTLLPNDALDTDYIIGPGGLGGAIGDTPQVRVSPIPNPWLDDNASALSRWLVLPGTGIEGINVAAENYFFDTTVDLTGFDPATAQLTGLQYAADNKMVSVQINGTTIFSQNSDFAEEFPDFISLGDVGLGLFQSGQNSIRFEVLNQGFSPLGLRVEGALEADPLTTSTAVPEPSSLVLMTLGLASLYYWRRCQR